MKARNAMDRTRRSLIAIIASLPLLPTGIAFAAGKTVTLHIASDGDELAFKPDHLTCPAGATVKLILRHGGKIIDDPHNWVLLKPGTTDAFLADADKIEDDTTVVPPQDKDKVLAATPMCQRHQTVTITFTAPAPGDYPFVCSVPGHGETMHGTLTVTS
jgi:azurin